MPSSIATYAAPTTSRHFQLLKAVEVAHETRRAAPGRRDTQHETSDLHHIVAHDDVLVRSWGAPLTSLLIQPLNAVEDAPGRRGTRHGTSDSHRLVSNAPTETTSAAFMRVVQTVCSRSSKGTESACRSNDFEETLDWCKATARDGGHRVFRKSPHVSRTSSIGGCV